MTLSMSLSLESSPAKGAGCLGGFGPCVQGTVQKAENEEPPALSLQRIDRLSEGRD